MRYWVQGKAPAGNWYDSLGTESYESAVRCASSWAKEQKKVFRIVIRTDEEHRVFHPDGQK